MVSLPQRLPKVQSTRLTSFPGLAWKKSEVKGREGKSRNSNMGSTASFTIGIDIRLLLTQ